MANHPTSPGVGEMKTILLIGVILAVTATVSMAGQSSVSIGLDGTISQMKQDLETQIERIRKARDTASSQMSLARIRIAEQLRRSEEDLTRQIESLERFREQMADQKDDTDQAVAQMQSDWKQFVQQAFFDLDSQLRDTNSLITQLETLRDKFDLDSEAISIPSSGQASSQTGAQSTAPTVTITPTTNPETVTTTDVQTTPATPETTTPTVTSITPTSTGST
jgi:hypothetical protein